jgi:hypothetical protein
MGEVEQQESSCVCHFVRCFPPPSPVADAIVVVIVVSVAASPFVTSFPISNEEVNSYYISCLPLHVTSLPFGFVLKLP